MFKKRLLIVTTVVVFTLFSATTVFATLESGTWSNPSGSYAPSSGSYYTNSETGTIGCSNPVKLRMYSIKYDSNEVNAIKDYYNNNSYYHGLDATDMSISLDTETSDMATNYPGYKFDTDDDDGNGNNEEAELVSLDSTNINTTTNYYFYVDWLNKGNPASITSCHKNGYIEMNAHESKKPWWTSEYNTVYFSTLDTVNYYTQ
jgi:hypothetical protein